MWKYSSSEANDMDKRQATLRMEVQICTVLFLRWNRQLKLGRLLALEGQEQISFQTPG